MLVLVVTKAGIGNGAVRFVELDARNPGDLRPEGGGCIEVEPLMEVETDPKTGLIDGEEGPEPLSHLAAVAHGASLPSPSNVRSSLVGWAAG